MLHRVKELSQRAQLPRLAKAERLSAISCITRRAARMSVPIGLLAGAGRFPVVFAEKARAQGHRVCCVGLRHLAPDELRGLCSEFHPVGI